MEVSQIYRTTNAKVLCNDQTFMDMLNLLEIELSSRAHEDDEEKAEKMLAWQWLPLPRMAQGRTRLSMFAGTI